MRGYLARSWAAAVALVYGSLIVFIISVLSTDPWRASALLLPFLALDLVFLWTLSSEHRSLAARRVTWIGMVAGAVPMISFAFWLVPLLLTCAPVLVPPERLTARR